MKKQPLVSVIVPCYNHEMFLDDCLMGIMNQNYQNIELFICDDNSSDNSFAKIKSYEGKLKERFCNVVIQKNEKNLGVTKNINRMLEDATGEYIKLIASDDVMAEDAIYKMAQFMEENPKVDVIVANGVKITEQQHYPNYESKDKIYSEQSDFSKEGLFERTYIHNDIFAPGVMMRKRVYEKYGNYDESVAIEDLEFWLRILKDEQTIFAYLDDILIYYRINQNSMTSLFGNKGLEQRRKRFHKAEIQILDKYGKCVDSRIYAETKMYRILCEKGIAVSNGLIELEEFVKKEYREFDLWNCISMKKRIFFHYVSLRYSIKKIIVSFR